MRLQTRARRSTGPARPGWGKAPLVFGRLHLGLAPEPPGSDGWRTTGGASTARERWATLHATLGRQHTVTT